MAGFNNLRSKNDRAIVAYLASALPVRNDAATGKPVLYVFPALWSAELSFANGPILRVRSHSGHPQSETRMGGTYNFQVEICAEGPAVNQDGQQNPADQRLDLDSLLSLAADALSLSGDDGQTLQATADAITDAGRLLATTGTAQQLGNNADMVNYTLQYWYPSLLDGGNPRAEGGAADTTAWKEIIGYEAICCAANVS